MLALFQSVGASRFVLTWRGMDGQTVRVRKHWTPPTIDRQLPALLAEAERDRLNLFLRPYAASASLIQLDDLTPERVAALASVSFPWRCTPARPGRKPGSRPGRVRPRTTTGISAAG
jgi:hypothetical protein